jgi:hypothetical protein
LAAVERSGGGAGEPFRGVVARPVSLEHFNGGLVANLAESDGGRRPMQRLHLIALHGVAVGP